MDKVKITHSTRIDSDEIRQAVLNYVKTRLPNIFSDSATITIRSVEEDNDVTLDVIAEIVEESK